MLANALMPVVFIFSTLGQTREFLLRNLESLAVIFNTRVLRLLIEFPLNQLRVKGNRFYYE